MLYYVILLVWDAYHYFLFDSPPSCACWASSMTSLRFAALRRSCFSLSHWVDPRPVIFPPKLSTREKKANSSTFGKVCELFPLLERFFHPNWRTLAVNSPPGLEKSFEPPLLLHRFVHSCGGHEGSPATVSKHHRGLL